MLAQGWMGTITSSEAEHHWPVLAASSVAVNSPVNLTLAFQQNYTILPGSKFGIKVLSDG
jgi:hypothetical protein